MKINDLVLFRPLDVYTISNEPLSLFIDWQINNSLDKEIDFFNSLLKIKEQYALDGQLFQVYLTLILAHHENSFTLSLERKEKIPDVLKTIVLEDLEIIFKLFHYDFSNISDKLKPVFENYKIGKTILNQEVHNILTKLCHDLSKCIDANEFYDILSSHYYTYGVGFYGLNKAFRYDDSGLVPIENVEPYTLSDIIGYDMQKQKLVDNTKAFLLGEKANNVLLYGDSGTGKSTSIKAILNDFYKDGLRIVEVYKHQFKHLPDIIHQLQNRDYKFIIYMDDLSFEDFEIEYKYLKSVIEGGLEEKPKNIVIYATSNRRHLIKQTWSERQNIDEISLNDAMQEKMSLVNRFGISILFSHPMKKEYLNIVDQLAAKNNIVMDVEDLHAKALAWEIRNGGFSGRTATQFIQYILNQKALDNF